MNCTICKTEVDKSHYSSAYHMDNSRRFLDGRPILSPQEFADSQEVVASLEVVFECEYCLKKFNKEKKMENHLKSHFMQTEQEEKERFIPKFSEDVLVHENFLILGDNTILRGKKGENKSCFKNLQNKRIIKFQSSKDVDSFVSRNLKYKNCKRVHKSFFIRPKQC